MKKLISYTLIVFTQLFALNSCQTYEDIYDIDLLYGTWICTNIDESELPTDNNFVFQFNNDRTGLYALGVRQLVVTPTWKENTNIIYALRGDVVVLTFRTANGVEQVMEMKIQSLTSTKLKYTIINYKIDGVDQSDNKTYTLTKSDVKLNSQIVGYWQGRLPGQQYDFIFQFKTNGDYDFYQYDAANKKYIYHNLNDSHYKLYGNLLVSIYSNDVTRPDKGDTFECWKISIETPNAMHWQAKRANGESQVFDLIRINGLPAEQ